MKLLCRELLKRVAYRLLSFDIPWLVHRVRLAIYGVQSIARPEPVVSVVPLSSFRVPIQNLEGLPRMLVFSHNLEREGASISLKELVCELHRRREVTVVLVSFQDGPLRAEYESSGVEVCVYGPVLNRVSTITRLQREVSRLGGMICKYQADLVFVNTLLNFPAVLAAERAGVPSIWNPRESEHWNRYFGFLPNEVAEAAVASIGLPRKVVFVARATREVWQDYACLESFEVIHNSLNLDRFVSLRSDAVTAQRGRDSLPKEVTILCVGTLCERKGQMDLILAIKRIIPQLSRRIRLVFVGGAHGRYGREVRRQGAHLSSIAGLTCEWVAATEAVGNYYREADLFVICSRVESYPRVVLEAMAFGLPIISTPVFGIVEQLPADSGALFYEPGDIDQLGNTIQSLVNDDVLRQRAKDSIKVHFSRMQTFDEMVDKYTSVIYAAMYAS